ncbi:putative hydroxypyruvate isomerase [Littorina saxatilis]|uniref:Putative hydroxypyruvate isomerase n=1 Tax=Littorina saxatilis TaxID=31220 RepID=A0AAN9B5M1_9CAEN
MSHMTANLVPRLCVRVVSASVANISTATMPLKFAANLSMMFQEIATVAERYKAAKDAGFQYVEVAFPYHESMESLSSAKKAAGLEQILINSYPGDISKGDLGIAIFPDRVDEFREKLEMSIQYAKALDCKRMHVMAGKKPADIDEAMLKKFEETFISNMTYAADRLQKEGILALAESVNERVSVPNYFLGHPHKALQYVKKINHPNLKVQFDVFHVQIMDGSITQNLKEQFPYIGHVQISQVPDRGEPDENGEICFPYFFNLLQEMGYNGFVGCEYVPRGSTIQGLKWMKSIQN